MIKNIFLPEQIDNYFLFPKRIIGIYIGSTSINATQLYAKGRSFIIEKYIQEPIETNTSLSLTERTIAALKKIKTQIDPYHELHTVLASHFIVFKELKLPFDDYEKIKLVIHFEVEPLLPFAIKDAVIDFIITKHIPEEHSCEILIAATQKKHITEHLYLFEQAEMNPTAITADLFSLYALYQQIPHYHELPGSVILLGLDLYTTQAGHIHNNQLRAIRTIGKGLYSIVKNASDNLKIPITEVMDHFMRFGLIDTDKPLITEALKKATIQFLNEINFTLNSFAAQTMQETINTIFIFGDGLLIKDLVPFIDKTITIPTKSFSIKELLNTKKLVLKSSLTDATDTHLISIGAAMPNKITAEFNLLQKGSSSSITNTLLLKQIGALLLVTLLSVSLLLTYSFLESKKIETEIINNKKEAIQYLKNQFTTKIDYDPDTDQEFNTFALTNALDQATRALKSEEQTWFAFSGYSRTSFLKYLLELTNLIDRKELGFVIDTLTITNNNMTIKARVNDYPALKILETELKKSPLFSYVEPQAEPNFSMKITLAQTNEGKL